MAGKTLFDKIWEQHVVTGKEGEPQLLYVDLHLIHEVTSPQAFQGLRDSNRKLRRPDKTFGTVDHENPTINPSIIEDPVAQLQIDTLTKNCQEFGVTLYGNLDEHQGIVHIIGPELGLTKTNQIIVCGDSHTATHGGLGNIAFGIGTSEVEHVMATQTIWQLKPKQMRIRVEGELPKNCEAKDIILYIIRKFGVGAGIGYAVEYSGPVIEKLSRDERLTISNMSIEFGARFGLIANNLEEFQNLNPQFSDADAKFDKELTIDVTNLEPQVTWGTDPSQTISLSETIPEVREDSDKRALEYTKLRAGQKLSEIELDYVFIGSCTNGRLSDLENAAFQINGRHKAKNIRAIVVPGSRGVKREAERLGLDELFLKAGFEWREPGCSACLAMNPDKFPPGSHVASTTNRNFEGRQGQGAITHLCSPKVAIEAAILGTFPEKLENE